MLEKLEKMFGYVAELGVFLTELKLKLGEIYPNNAKTERAVKKYLDGFTITSLGAENRIAKMRFEFGQYKKEGIKGEFSEVKTSHETGGEEMIKLKYGQGSICRKTRIRKKDNSVYVIYEGRYYNEFGKIKSVYAKTQRECAQLLKKALAEKKKPGRHISTTLSEWVLTWYNSYKKEAVRPSTRRNYEANVKVIMETFGKTKLNALSGEMLQKYFNGIESGNTRKKLFNFLNACLEKAVVLKKIDSNPCRTVELPKYRKQRRRAITYVEQQTFFAKLPDKLAQAVFFLCATGLRVGEFIALTKDDFFFEDHFFKVDKAIVDGIKGQTKSEASNRVVYFTDKLFEYFNLDLLGTFTYAGLRTAFDRFCQANGIEGISLHSTRHTFSTICYSLGVNEKVLQALMGHSTLAMTQDTYTHLLKKGTSKVYCYLEELCTFIRTNI